VSEHRRRMEEGHATPDMAGGDHASALESLEVEAAIAESEANLIEKIHRALERLDAGAYGICENCGEKIPKARLDAKPSVSLCVICQEEREEG